MIMLAHAKAKAYNKKLRVPFIVSHKIITIIIIAKAKFNSKKTIEKDKIGCVCRSTVSLGFLIRDVDSMRLKTEKENNSKHR